jgi:TonB family protein
MKITPLRENFVTKNMEPKLEASSPSEHQLSFDEFLAEEDIPAKLALIPYTDYHLINAKEFTFPKRRFFILSVAAHFILIALALTIVVQKMQKTEIVEVDYVSAETAAPAPMKYAPVEIAPVADIPPVEKVAPKEPVVGVKPVAKTVVVVKPTPAKSSSRAKTEAVSYVEPMADISDIAVPTLNEASTNEVAHLSTKEIENDFDKIDEDQNSKFLAAVKDDTQMFDDSAAELDQTTQAVANENSAALENAAAEKLKNLNAQKAELNKARQAAGPTGNGAQHGVGSESEGIVRSLEDLEQKPGNPRPNYDVQDRMNGLSGTIIINAFVTKDGNLTLFRLIQSTGHRNLDRKTLSALKEWKFYPGQEGWVELPFKWDLKGGVQQKPTLLKRQ